MKKLFIYYSLTGNGDYLAEILKEKGYDIRKVEEKHKAPKKFFFRVMEGGFRAGLKIKGKLVDYNNDINEYEEVVIGSPVWNGQFPPAINGVLYHTNLSEKKLTFLFYSGSGDDPKALKIIKKNYAHARVIVTKEPKTHSDQLDKLVDL